MSFATGPETQGCLALHRRSCALGQRGYAWNCQHRLVQVSSLTATLGITINGLFGEYCAGDVFLHDEYMTELAKTVKISDLDHHHSQTSADSTVEGQTQEFAPAPAEQISSSQACTASLPNADHQVSDHLQDQEPVDTQQPIIDLALDDSDTDASQNKGTRCTISAPAKRTREEFVSDSHMVLHNLDSEETTNEDIFEGTSHLIDSQESFVSALTLENRRIAFNAVMDASNLCGWPGLLSTTNNHNLPESELGEG